MELKSDINLQDIIEEVNIFLFDMPEEYSLGHCVAKDMRMSAGIAMHFKLVNTIVLIVLLIKYCKCF